MKKSEIIERFCPNADREALAKLPKKHILAMIFLEGKAPPTTAMLGPNGEIADWKVTMLTGLIPNMESRPFCHQKTMTMCLREIVGHNILFGTYYWGYFKLSESDGFTNSGSLLIDYNVPENNFVTRRIRDFLRTTADPNVMIGQLRFRIGSKWVFLGYFLLTHRCTVVTGKLPQPFPCESCRQS